MGCRFFKFKKRISLMVTYIKHGFKINKVINNQMILIKEL